MKKVQFLQELRTAIREEIRINANPQPTWMRSSQVRKMLSISDSTLQTLRINGTITGYKMGPTWLYKQDEITAVLEANSTKRKEVING